MINVIIVIFVTFVMQNPLSNVKMYCAQNRKSVQFEGFRKKIFFNV